MIPFAVDCSLSLGFFVPSSPGPKIPPSEAKNRLAAVTAAKAVAFALTPGVDVIKFVTLWSRKRGMGPYVEFVRSEESLEPSWHPEVGNAADQRCVGGFAAF